MRLAAHTIAEVKERFAELNIACAKVLTVPELESNPQYVARESITQWQTMDGRTCKGPNIMPKFKNNHWTNLARNALTWHGHGCHFEKYRLQRKRHSGVGQQRSGQS